MKRNSSSLFSGNVLVVAVATALALCGCSEAFQRKFVRRKKTADVRPSPVVRFHDYSQTMTPLERYRKHYLMFDYWNGQLMEELSSSTPNPKRLRRASQQSLAELETLKQLVVLERVAVMEPVLVERRQLDGQLQSGPYHPAALTSIRLRLEAQSREIDRELDWRKITDAFLTSQAAPAPDAS